MENIKKEAFLEWAKKHDWLQILDAGLKQGFLTPNGNIVLPTFTLSGDLEKVEIPMPMPPMARRPFDLKGSFGIPPFEPP